MEKMKFETVDGTRRNVDKIAEMFPQVVTEVLGEDGKLKRAVKWDVLKELLSGDYVEGGECYEFTWPGKRAAIAKAAKPIRKTLRPCKEESKNWDTTENLYIEGDNLDVLKLLQESYLGKVKMIYIDPPYNTGNDFVYKDNFTKDKKTSENELGLFDKETEDRTMSGELFKNTEANGKFHSDWCSMIYCRIKLAVDLLKDDGIIFISIDDHEIRNLKNICDEILGESNFISQLIWQNKKGGGNDSKHIAIEHEYILVYAKNKNALSDFYEAYSPEYMNRYKEKDDVGAFFWDTFKRKSGKQYYPITCPDGTVLEYDSDGNPISWLRSKARFDEDIKNGEIRIIEQKGNWSVQFKQRMPQGKKPRSIFITETVITEQGTTSTGSDDVYKYFKKDVFSNPKPVELLSFLLGFGMQPNDIIIDFFSGSATTAEAVLKSNALGNSQKFILVQMQEDIGVMLNSSSENAKRVASNAIAVLDELNRPHFLTELAKERIRRAGEKIKEEAGLAAADLDIGFRVFKVADSNMKDVYYSAGEYSQDMLDSLVSNIKEDRTDLDLLYGCLLEWGVELSLPHTSETIDNVTVHTVNNGDLIACFDADIPESAIRTIAKRQPLRAIFRDSSFSSAPQKINVEEIFKLLSPSTTVKVI